MHPGYTGSPNAAQCGPVWRHPRVFSRFQRMRSWLGGAKAVPSEVTSACLEASERAEGSGCVLPNPTVREKSTRDSEGALDGAIPNTIVGCWRGGQTNTAPPRVDTNRVDTNRVRVNMLNGDLVLEAEVGQTTVEGLKDKTFDLTKIRAYRQQLVMSGVELSFMGPDTMVELRSLHAIQPGTSQVLLVVLDEDTESMAPMTIQKNTVFAKFC